MEILVLSGLIAVGVLSGYNRGYAVRRREFLNTSKGEIFRVFIPDDKNTVTGAEFRDSSSAFEFARGQRSAVIRSDKGVISRMGSLTPQEERAKSVRFEQSPWFKIKDSQMST